MAEKFPKGRAVAARERGVYEHCTRLFLSGQIHGFWAFDSDEWALQANVASPPLPRTFDEMKDTLRRIDPSGCVWDKPAKAASKPSRGQLEAFIAELLDTGVLRDQHVLIARALLGRTALHAVA